MCYIEFTEYSISVHLSVFLGKAPWQSLMGPVYTLHLSYISSAEACKSVTGCKDGYLLELKPMGEDDSSPSEVHAWLSHKH